jgi:DNA polymerase-3 subunit gamma/tau
VSYTVIARKYRPQRFADITAQEHITRTLQNAIRTGRIAHGYIFAGSRGVGKTTSARILAKALNCEKILTDETYRQKVAEPCGMCESCQDFDAGASVNIAEFDAASNNSVEDIRILRENVRYGPQKGKYKVYIIDEFHMLSTAAFNAFLKTLEEPPPHAVFIFATTELHKVPATISSRCQKFIFKRIAADDIAQRLAQICQQEHIDIDQESLNLIARKADGAMRDAQSLLDQVIAFCTESGKGKIEYAAVADLLNIIDDERFFDVSDAILEQDSRKMLSVSQFVYQNGFDVSDFLQRLIAHFRNFLIVKNVRSTKLIETAEHWKKRYEKDAERFSTDALMRYIDAITEAEQSIRFAREPQLRLEILLFKLMALKDNSELEARLAKVEQAVQLLQEEIKKKRIWHASRAAYSSKHYRSTFTQKRDRIYSTNGTAAGIFASD